nr:hypothetical protein [Paraburkholderia sp. BL8N3]
MGLPIRPPRAPVGRVSATSGAGSAVRATGFAERFDAGFAPPCSDARVLPLEADLVVGGRFTPVAGRAALFGRDGRAVVLFFVLIGRVSVCRIPFIRNLNLQYMSILLDNKEFAKS